MHETAGSAAAPAARCRKFRRGSFMIGPSVVRVTVLLSKGISRSAAAKLGEGRYWHKAAQADPAGMSVAGGSGNAGVEEGSGFWPKAHVRENLEPSSSSAHSSSDFVSAMEAAGMLIRVKEEKRVDELPRVMEDHPTTAVLVDKITGCEFSFLANAYSNQDQYAWAMGCKKAETGMKMVEASLGRIAPVLVDTAPCKEVVLTGDDV